MTVVLDDPADAVFNGLAQTPPGGIPASYVLDVDGTVIKEKHGAQSNEQMNELTKAAAP